MDCRDDGATDQHGSLDIDLEILAERRAMSAVMCLKVARLFGSSPEMWMRLQAAWELRKAEQDISRKGAKTQRNAKKIRSCGDAVSCQDFGARFEIVSEYYDCFLSYCSADVASAEALHGRLVAAGFRVWRDKVYLEAGMWWQDVAA